MPADWEIFGPAAICFAIGRSLPPVVDVAISASRPSRDLLIRALGASGDLQLRYVTEKPEPVVDLECITLFPAGTTSQVTDPTGVLKTRKVRLLRNALALHESLRVKFLASYFPEFDWPDYLVRKLDSDFAFAKIAAREDQAVLLALDNLAHDFGRTEA